MKKTTFLSLTLILSLQLFSQEIQPVEHKPVKTDYLAKSKKQRTVGWMLTGTGIAMTWFGYAMIMKHFEEGFGYSMSMSAGEPSENLSDAVAVLYLSGIAMVPTGITFLSIAKKNKRKALSMSFRNESLNNCGLIR